MHAVAAGTANIIVKGKYTEYTFPVQVLSDAQVAVDGMELCDVENGNIFSSGDGRYGVYCEHPFSGMRENSGHILQQMIISADMKVWIRTFSGSVKPGNSLR